MGRFVGALALQCAGLLAIVAAVSLCVYVARPPRPMFPSFAAEDFEDADPAPRKPFGGLIAGRKPERSSDLATELRPPAAAASSAGRCPGGVCPSPAPPPSNCPGGVCPSPGRGGLIFWRRSY